MAAICASICAAPCKLLGALCGACDSCLSAVCSCACCPENRPSPIFLTYSLLFQVPVVAAGIGVGVYGLGHWDDCKGDKLPAPIWLLVAAGLGVFFIAFAARVYYVFSRDYVPERSDIEQGTAARQSPPSIAGRLYHTACYDPFVFIYFFAAPGAFIWAILGFVSAHKTKEPCDNSVANATVALAILMLIYLLFTVVVGLISCGVEAARQRSRPASAAATTTHHMGGPMAHVLHPAFGQNYPSGYAQQVPAYPAGPPGPTNWAPTQQTMGKASAGTAASSQGSNVATSYPLIAPPAPHAQHAQMQQAYSQAARPQPELPGPPPMEHEPPSAVDKLVSSAGAAAASGLAKVNQFFGKSPGK